MLKNLVVSIIYALDPTARSSAPHAGTGGSGFTVGGELVAGEGCCADEVLTAVKNPRILASLKWHSKNVQCIGSTILHVTSADQHTQHSLPILN